MFLNSSLATTVRSGVPYFRITSLAFQTTDPADHIKVVNGQGAVKSKVGARYNYPGALAVYLADDLETCFAEKMFYFHREVLRGIDLSHLTGVIPPFRQQFVLWGVIFGRDVTDVLDLADPRAPGFFGIFPSMMTNPSQDYEHLKYKRADIESSGYKGLQVQSSRAKRTGNIVVLFEDQSPNIDRIVPYPIEFRLVNSGGTPFVSHAQDILDFTVGEVRITGSALPAGAAGGNYQYWQRVSYNH